MKKKILIIIMILFIIPVNVHALSGTLKIACDKQNLTIGSSAACHITATTDGETSSLHSVINVSEGLEITSVTVDDIWEGDDDKVLDLYTADNKSGTFAVANFIIKATKTGNHNITLNDTKLGDKNFKEYSFSISTYDIKVTANEEPNNSSTTSNPSSSSTKPSSSSSTKPSSSSSTKPSSSSTSQQNRIPIFSIELSDTQVLINKQIELSFTANTQGLIKITTSNNKVLSLSSEKYNLSTNETKIFKLIGKSAGTSNVVIEFIPDNNEYKTITETRKITVKSNNNTNSSSKPNPDSNVDVNPPTGNMLFIIIGFIGLSSVTYLFVYYKKSLKK